MSSSKTVRSTAIIMMAAGVLAGTLLTSAGAHQGSPAHEYNAHLYKKIKQDFFTKPAAKRIFNKVRHGSHMRNFVAWEAGGWITSAVSADPLQMDPLTINFTVPAGETWYGITTFSAESACWGTSAYCVVDVLVNGDEDLDLPNAGANFAFDSSDSNNEGSGSWEGHVMERLITPLPPGAHEVTFIAWVTNGAASFRLDDVLVRLDLYRCKAC